MKPELKVVKLEDKEVKEELVAKLDFTNPDHRKILTDMIVTQTVKGLADVIKDMPFFGEVVLDVVLKPIINDTHNRAWGRAGDTFPQLIEKKVRFDATTGEFFIKK